MDKEQELMCIEQKENLKKLIKSFLKNDPKSGVRISVSSMYGSQTVGYDAELFLKILNKECNKSEHESN